MGTDTSDFIDSSIDSLFIVDDEYADGNALCLQYAAEAQAAWERFLALSSEVVGDSKIIEGDRAKSYAAFIEIAKKNIGGSIGEIMERAVADMTSYIGMIDEADQCLY